MGSARGRRLIAAAINHPLPLYILESLESRRLLSVSLDGAFGGASAGGIVRFDPSGQATDAARAVALQSDGKSISVGVSYGGRNNGDDFILVRLNTDGSADTSFGP